MRKTLLFGFLLAVVLVGSSAYVISSSGITNTTGSPGESTCTACHGGGGGTTAVTISGTPAFTGNMYVPGQTYTVNVQVANNSFSKFGFDAEILNSSNSNAGTITSGLTGVKILGTKKNATHTTPKAGTGSATFSFVWIAPSAGNAIVYAAGNAVNGNNTTSGDTPGSANLTLSPDLSAGVNEATATTVSGLSVFPNPVQNDFSISYNLIEEGSVKIILQDLQGKELTELLNEKQNPGGHISRTSLPSGLAKGVYFVKISVNEKPSAQRLIITQ